MSEEKPPNRASFGTGHEKGEPIYGRGTTMKKKINNATSAKKEN
jgi:hypothetical protein